MGSLAAFIMRGRLQAILVIAAGSIVAPLFWLGGGALALVTLRRGWFDGVTALAGAAALVALAHAVTGGAPALVLGTLVELWLPLLVLALWLRFSISLASTLRLAALLAALAVLAMYWLHPDQAAYWKPLFEQMGKVIVDGSPEAAKTWAALEAHLLPMMTGVWLAGIVASVVICLLVGRWLQAMLYNPGGFRGEFHSLDLGRYLALAVAALVAVGTLKGPGLAYDLALASGAVFIFQALALAHAVVAAKGWGKGWLVGVYLLLIVVFELYVVIGIADALFEWRRRLTGRTGPDDAA